jgi:hypothetical protein
MIKSALALTNVIPNNPMAIHRFNTFLWMTALSNRSEVSYLSRAEEEKVGSINGGEELGTNHPKSDPNGSCVAKF